MGAAAMPVDPATIARESDRRRKAAALQYLAQQFRITVLDILHERGTRHWGGASSPAELLVALYFDVLRVRPDEPRWRKRDRFAASKCRASCMLYAVLAHRSFFPVEELPAMGIRVNKVQLGGRSDEIMPRSCPWIPPRPPNSRCGSCRLVRAGPLRV